MERRQTKWIPLAFGAPCRRIRVPTIIQPFCVARVAIDNVDGTARTVVRAVRVVVSTHRVVGYRKRSLISVNMPKKQWVPRALHYPFSSPTLVLLLVHIQLLTRKSKHPRCISKRDPQKQSVCLPLGWLELRSLHSWNRFRTALD